MKKRSIFILIAAFIVTMTAVTLFAVKTSALPVSYDLYIQGAQVTSSNLSGDGWSFDPDTYTLTLNGAVLGTGENTSKNITTTQTITRSFKSTAKPT